jgi:PAS domain S-box-containing protein
MNTQVRIVILEDSAPDAELSVRELRRNGFEPQVVLVEREQEFREALGAFKPDLILADSVLPHFSGTRGLEIAREIAPDVPVVFVSGTLGEEKAVELFKAGATDYVPKHQISRLGPVIERALREAEERRKNEQSERRLVEQGRLLDLAHEAILVRDWESGKVTYWNPSAERVYGWSAEEALGRDISPEIFGDLADREPIIEALIAKGSWQGNLRQKHKNGSGIIVDGRVTLIRDPAGNPKSVLIINTDVTAQKRLEAQLLRTQRLESIGTLASGIAHDLNNILAPILMSASILREDDLPEEVRETMLTTIESSAQRGAEIVKQVLTFARGSQGEWVPIQLSHLLAEIQRFAQETFPKDIVILNDVSRDLWPVNGDATQIHQVLLNLCINARDAMPKGGQLTLEAENFVMDDSYASMLEGAQPGNYVLVKVSDTGCGIAPELAGRIFDPFFTTKEAGKGTGLGLSTVAGILKGHGGIISVNSAPGIGTTFEVYFPAVVEARVLQSGPPQPVPLGGGELILVVDDEAPIRRMASSLLEAKNYRVITASNGTEGVAAYVAHRQEIAAVITDVTMPVMDGIALTHALRQINPEVRVIISTGRCEETKISGLESLEVCALLMKPYTSKTLLRTLGEALGK